MATSAAAMSVQDAINLVLEANPEIKSAESNKRAIEHELDQAQSFFSPLFSLEAWAGSSYDGGDTINDAGAASNSIEGYSVTGRVSQRIYDGGETRSEIERQAWRVDAAALRVMERSEALGLEAVRLYADMLRGQALLRLSRENLSYHRNVQSRIENGFQSGVVSGSDLQQSLERVVLAEDTVLDFELALAELAAEFVEVVGIEPTQLGSVPGTSAAIPGTLEAALAVARRTNPTIRFHQADVGAAEALANVANANRFPRLNLEADVTAGEDVNGFEGDVLDSRVGIVLRYDIQGNRKRAERQEQAERVGQSRAELLSQTRLVERTVRSNWATRQTVAKRVGLLERQAGLSRELRTLYEREYEVGTRSLLDILNTQNALFQAEAELINARSLNTYINYRMLASMGVMLSTLGIQPPEDAKPYARDLVKAPQVNAVETDERFDARSLSKWRRDLN